jgi:hypothetical protein
VLLPLVVAPSLLESSPARRSLSELSPQAVARARVVPRRMMFN